MYTLNQIVNILQLNDLTFPNTVIINHLLTDSRRLIFPSNTLFFAIESNRNNGHAYINELYAKGVYCFVVNENWQQTHQYPKAHFLPVKNVVNALQQIAAHHRRQFNYPVIGITGSNGKTIVKEWLYQCLQNSQTVVRSPRSYNSQIGVPLSVWQMNASHQLAIFEAGISTVNEMENLASIIQPTIGIFTYLGEAHQEGFSSKREKALEKLSLFKTAECLIYGKDYLIDIVDIEKEGSVLLPKTKRFFSWSLKEEATLRVTIIEKLQFATQINCTYEEENFICTIPFGDEASVQNAISCIATLLALEYSIQFIQQQIAKLSPVEMRLQLKTGINNCVIINDSYSNDISSLNIALQYLQLQAGLKPATVVLSDLLQTGIADNALYEQVAILLHQYGVKKLIGIGKKMQAFAAILQKWIPISQFYTSTDDFLQLSVQHGFQNECILLKGARSFEFEKINNRLSWQLHQTVMEVNLTAIVHNLNLFKKQLLPNTKLMAMVKAFSYGSGTLEVARLLQFHKVDYLAVAYADEGIALRKGGIHLPIMVMNAENSAFDALIQYQLEPEIFSFQIYSEFNQYLLSQGIQQFPVHIKVNTGMNRLGFETTELTELAYLINSQQTMVVQSAFSHLVASENSELDEFTQQQAALFATAVANFENQIGYKLIKHISNSAGITRHNELQYNMVRLGIGLYGINSSSTNSLPLDVVATLKTTIAQIRHVAAGQTVGYNRRGLVKNNSRIATLRIGYADGFNRLLGNGNAYVLIRGKKAYTIGAVCMDMVMVDITHIPEAEVNDEVEIFGKHLPIQQVAEWCNTIAYEIITTVGQRVKRVYFEE